MLIQNQNQTLERGVALPYGRYIQIVNFSGHILGAMQTVQKKKIDLNLRI
jgi:hypothetical protein